MGFFDLFKKKKSVETQSINVEQSTTVCQQETTSSEQPVDQQAKSPEAVEEIARNEAEALRQEAEAERKEAEAERKEAEAERKELEAGLEKTKEGFFGKLKRAIAGRTTVDADVLDDLEEVLITSDVGVETTVKIIERIEARVARDKYMNTAELHSILRDEIAQLMEE